MVEVRGGGSGGVVGPPGKKGGFIDEISMFGLTDILSYEIYALF